MFHFQWWWFSDMSLSTHLGLGKDGKGAGANEAAADDRRKRALPKRQEAFLSKDPARHEGSRVGSGQNIQVETLDGQQRGTMTREKRMKCASASPHLMTRLMQSTTFL
jgi:hypothetical protein